MQLIAKTVPYRFSRPGFHRHQAGFETTPWRDLGERSVLVTGGTDGIGLALSHRLANRGAFVHMWARNPDKGARAEQSLAGRFHATDLGDLPSVADSAYGFHPERPLAAVVLNAGAMPLTRTLTKQGHELVWASQVLGHLLLLRVLHQRGMLGASTPVVWVSSGGMYFAPLDFSDIVRDTGYQRHSVYAMAKRAQVELAKHLAMRWPDVPMASMHPGWVKTAGVEHSMPLFHRLTRRFLRTPDQGADTIDWLVSQQGPFENGRFWFDRKVAKEHRSDKTRPSSALVDELVQRVFCATDPYLEEQDA